MVTPHIFARYLPEDATLILYGMHATHLPLVWAASAIPPAHEMAYASALPCSALLQRQSCCTSALRSKAHTLAGVRKGGEVVDGGEGGAIADLVIVSAAGWFIQ